MAKRQRLTPRKFSPRQIADLWGVGYDTVMMWIASGRLKAIDISPLHSKYRRFLVDEADLLAFDASLEYHPPSLGPAPRRRVANRQVVKEYF